MVRTILELGLITAIVVAVGGFGGTEPISWGIAQAVIILLGLLLVVNSPGRDSLMSRQRIWIPITLFAWVAIQWIGSSHGRIGFDTHAIQTQGLALVTSTTAFYIALEVARECKSCKRLALSLIALGLVEAVYGLAQYLTGWQQIWNVQRRFYIGSATGTYVNHNHFAGLLEMILPLALGLAYYHGQKGWRGWRHYSPRDYLSNMGNPAILKSLLLFLAVSVFFLAVAFSLSRMGMISMVASIGIMGAVVSVGKKRSLLAAALTLVSLVGGVAAAAWVGVAPVVEHFGQLPLNESPVHGNVGRIAIWMDALKLLGEHPWSGVGLGCFEVAYTMVQSTHLTYVADHAHNDYLELATELGLPAAVLLFSILFWLTARILHASRCATSSLARALALGSLGGSSALLVHSVADFNLYIPANGLVFAILLGMGYAMSLDASASDKVRSPRTAEEVTPSRAIFAGNKRTHQEDEDTLAVSGPMSS